MYWYVLVGNGTHILALLKNSTEAICFAEMGRKWYVLICVDTGFRGSHRDAAMPPPSADMEDGDPHPRPVDEEFFDCRPDAADMEEAIGKFMEGMEKQERTGFAALHKLLQGLPVPVLKTAGCMTQAEASEGGFLRDLDEDEKKWFTPSELLLYKVAVEHRYITVHNGTALYVLVHTSTY